MNKKQWIVLGIGLIIMGILFSVLSNKALDGCNILIKDSLETYGGAVDSDMSILEKQSFYPDTLIHSCYNQSITMGAISSISWTLGIIFIILGFLEDKKK